MPEKKPYRERLAKLLKAALPPRALEDPILAAHVQRTAEMDVRARAKMAELKERLPLLVYSSWESSSGFRMATELRRFWYEYADRFGKFGPTALPSSFNVIEAFIRFDENFFTFVLRPERDHLLRFSEYLEWYTASSFPEEPRSLIDIMEEGVVYSYDFVLDPSEPLLAAEESKLLMVGISLIRHRDEVTLLILAGETPPSVSDEVESDQPVRGKEKIRPAAELTANDRLLEGMPAYSRVLLASRFDLSNRLNDVRYLLRDLGRSYDIATDDFEMLRYSFGATKSDEKFRELTDRQSAILRRYSGLFSAGAATLFLPAFFIDQARNVVTSQFVTPMGADAKNTKVKRLRRVLGDDFFRPLASTACLVSPSAAQGTIEAYRVEPPTLHFKSTGYWMALDPNQIGKTAGGLTLVGKTWVERTEVWESTSPQEFIATRTRGQLPEDSAESIYIMRSPSHAANVYKIGSTTRDVASRRGELTSSTSAPLPFEVLASWRVTDASAVEKKIHEALASFRLSPRREFFRLPLSEIVRTIERILSGPEREQ
jgi:hypothetical protein